MRFAVISATLLVATYPAYGQRNAKNDTEAVSRACTVEECFLEGQVRDFEVIDRTHVIVYVGAQRCAFHVELRGALCDLSFAPELYFRRANEVPMISTSRPDNGRDGPSAVTPRTGSRTDAFDPFELDRRERRDLRVCSNDLSIQVHGGAWTESQSNPGTDRFGNPNAECRISNVTSITDDQLLEFYVGRGVVAPVPPMGTGQIEVGDQEEQAQQESAPAPPARGRRNAE